MWVHDREGSTNLPPNFTMDYSGRENEGDNIFRYIVGI
jgi:hypothetical protein